MVYSQFRSLFSEKKVQNKRNNYAYSDAGHNWYLDADIFKGEPKVAGKVAHKRYLVSDKNKNSYDHKEYSCVDQEFAEFR
jgi:hypothetical protein